uniref:Uncharacterized protein n=1 Tax=Pseudoalteromonas luteoviolacea TaxID=43657 RepID=A0A023PZ43_9GAMM|nr:hypothetical protein [Pseudoalteromonas luteoviolacea]
MLKVEYLKTTFLDTIFVIIKYVRFITASAHRGSEAQGLLLRFDFC